MAKKKSEVIEKPKEKIDIKNFKLEDLDDIGPIKAKRLRAAGVTTPLDFVVRGSQELSSIMDIKNEDAAIILDNVYKQLVEQGFLPNLTNVRELVEYRKKRVYFQTGSTIFDDLLGGGFESQGMTQIYGPEGAGKTQTLYTTIVLALSQGKPVMLVDSEGTFDIERAIRIANSRGFMNCKDPKNPTDEDLIFFDKMEYRMALDSDRIGHEIDTMIPVILEKDIKLIMFDGIGGKFRLEYSAGLGELGQRQNDIKPVMKHLQNMAEYLNLCIVITNQVMAKPGFISEDNVPIMGHIFGHNFKYIVRITKKNSPPGLRIVRFIKSNKHAMQDKEIFVNEEGLSDFEKLKGNKIVELEIKSSPEIKETGLIDKSLLQV